MSAGQDEVLRFLEAGAGGALPGPVKRIDTHGAIVFLGGADVYKVKRAVRLPYLDYSTLELRRRACVAEIEVNRDNAPSIYLGVEPVARDGGRLWLGGAGEVVEWLVHMRRFDESATLDLLAERDALSPVLMDALADAVAAAHARAPVCDGAAATVALRDVLVETLEELDGLPPELGPSVRAPMLAAFERLEPLLLRRGAVGQGRRCHGDLHLRNIALVDGTPLLFDAIEFDDRIAVIDVMYDLAFLLMDLCERGLRAFACRVLNRYLWAAEDELFQVEGLAALPLFLALRAGIRAKVLVTQSRLPGADAAALSTQAGAYLHAAARFMRPEMPRVVAIGGLSGTGKTVLAGGMAPRLGPEPGACHFRSDIERKRRMGVPASYRLPAEAYGAETTRATYAAMGDLARAALRAGRSVVFDATFRDAAERALAERVATEERVRFDGVWLEALDDARIARVGARTGDASDATQAVAAAQGAADVGDIAWRRLSAAGMQEETLRAALREIGLEAPL